MATQTTATAKNSARISNLRDHILAAAPKLPEELVHVADWDDADGTECIILVRSLTARERADFLRRILVQQPGQRAQPTGGAPAINWENYVADIVLMTARDPDDGALLFEPTHRDSLLAMAAAPIEQLASVARRLSGLEESSQAQARFSDSAD